MEAFNLIKVPYFLLDKRWQEDGVEFGRISFMLSSNESYEEHKKHVEEQKNRLIDENDDNYSSWCFTAEKYQNIGGAVGHVTVFHFRVRDAG
jgi:predicted Rossmann fold nucleotide-binding protein DprA/Smf involved in DNA uptake